MGSVEILVEAEQGEEEVMLRTQGRYKKVVWCCCVWIKTT
jgi:hypothetical protein